MSAAARTAVLGAGRIGRLHARNIARRVAGLELAVVADPSAEARRQIRDELGVAVADDWRAVVDDPRVDAVLVCSPTDAHAEQITAAADAGKPVFCEKPLDVTLESIDRLLARVAERGVALQLGFNRRFDRSFAALREQIAGGALGTVWTVRLASRDPAPPPAAYVAHAGGLALDMAIHDFDMVRFLTGGEIETVTMRGAAHLDGTPPGEVDTALTLLTLSGGGLAVIDNCRTSAVGYDQRAEVHGERGTAMVDNEPSHTVVTADHAGFHQPRPPHFFTERYAEAYVRELEAFGDVVAGRAAASPDGRDGRQAVAAAIAASRSLAEGRTVALAELAAAGAPSETGITPREVR